LCGERQAELPARESTSSHLQTEVLDNRLEVAIREQQRQSSLNAERSDDHIDGLAHGQGPQPFGIEPACDRFEAGGLLGNPYSSTTAGASAGPESITSKRKPGRRK
jgi:hypothetical protein